MNSLHRHITRATASLAFAFLPLIAMSARASEEAIVRQVIVTTWEKPGDHYEVGPIAVSGEHAVADWSQTHRGGRALLARDKKGQWAFVACGGDGLKDPKTLEATGVPATDAKRLSEALVKAEGGVAASRRALFSTFEGALSMGAHGGHGGEGAAGGKH